MKDNEFWKKWEKSTKAGRINLVRQIPIIKNYEGMKDLPKLSIAEVLNSYFEDLERFLKEGEDEKR